ncbi:hypothetical protein D3C84_1013310 [compost metagenome]
MLTRRRPMALKIRPSGRCESIRSMLCSLGGSLSRLSTNTFQPACCAVRSMDSSSSTANGVVAVSRANTPMVRLCRLSPRILRADILGTNCSSSMALRTR